MSLMNTQARYGSLSLAMHWLMALLLVAVYCCMELREFYPKGSDPRNALKAWHYTLGMTVFALVWLRLVLRLVQPTPAIEPPVPAWQNVLSRLVHLGLYVLMFGMPVVGWLLMSGEGKTVTVWGLELPALIAKDKALAHTLEEIHEFGADAGYALVAVHTAAALFHHYLVRDNTLRRMLPGH